jgi:hypothetical protein
MKDELEFLKKDWKNQEAGLPKMSYNEIYGLIHKKSSSIVKWIFIICIAELLFWSMLNLLVPESALKVYEEFNLKSFIYITQSLHYLVVICFIYLFYKNYKSISVIENTTVLMNKIIKTRKTVNYYVYYNIILYIILTVVLNIIMFSDSETLIRVMNPLNSDVENSTFLMVLLIVQIVVLFIVIGLLWLYYKLIYGILLKKLNKNYKELETLKL